MKKLKIKQAVKASKLAKTENIKNKTITVKNAEGEPDTEAEIIIQNKISYTPKVSVIIPVYNTEEYLRECLDSVINQTLKEIEIICVDDGSTDSSLEILKEYATKDNRFTVIAQKNLHAGVARNAGLAVAKGEYLSFLDSDDFFELNMLEEMSKKADEDESDVVICGNYCYDHQQKKDTSTIQYVEKYITASPFSPITFKENLFTLCNPNPWTKLFKTNLIKKNCIYFEKYISCNDLTFVYTMFALANKISVINNLLIHYRINSKTSTSSDRGSKSANLIYAAKKLENNLKQKKLYDIYKSTFEKRLLSSYKWEYNQCSPYQKETLKSTFEKYFNNSIENPIKISVIIPVYNVEKYLRQCLDSVINQTLKDIEIICVNDGSPDNSLQILQEYAAKDKRIIIVDQENQGLSCSRNNALKIARGKYIQFLDSDDWLRDDTCEIIYENMEKNDLDIFSFSGVNYIEKTGEEHKSTAFNCFPVGFNHQRFSYKDCISFLTKITISSCRNVYNRLFLEKYKIKFPEHLCFEENMFFLEAFFNAKKCGFIDELLYFRRVHSGSITQNWDKLFSDYLKISDMVINYLIEQKMPKEIISAYKTHYLNSCLWRYNTFNTEIKSKYVKELYKLFAKYDFFIKEKINPTYKQELQTWYYRVTGKYLNLENPRTFNEKIQWLKLYESTPIKTRLADKYLVRDWVKEKIGEEYLIPLLGVYDKFEEIDFDKLPNQFVMKCNHGSGWNIIVKDKSKLDLKDAKEKLDRWMNANFAFKYGYELHYRDIIPKIIIEKYINPDFSNHEIQCWVFNKEIKFISVETIKDENNLERGTFYINGTHTEFEISPNHYKRMEHISNHKAFYKAIELAQKLIVDTSYVRIDFIEYENDVRFREMTFTSGSGLSVIKPEKYNQILGNMIKLPKLAYNIDTGEYYKLPKKSKLKSWLLFPYNLCQKVYLTHKEMQLYLKLIKKQLLKGKIDVRALGKKKQAIRKLKDIIFAQNQGSEFVKKHIRKLAKKMYRKLKKRKPTLIEVLRQGQQNQESLLQEIRSLKQMVEYQSAEIKQLQRNLTDQ